MHPKWMDRWMSRGNAGNQSDEPKEGKMVAEPSVKLVDLIRPERDRKAAAKLAVRTKRERREQEERLRLQAAAVAWQETRQRRVERIAMGKLRVDPSYQRPLDEAHVKRIMKAFDPGLVGELEVNIRPDGRTFIIDGQHRWAALTRIVRNPDLFTVPCIINAVPTVQEEAKLYLARNHYIRPASRGTTFNARVAIGDEAALKAKELIERFGYEPYTGTGTHGVPKGALSVAAVERMLRHYADAAAVDALDAVRTVYGDRHSIPHRFFAGLVQFYAKFRDDPNFNPDRVRAVLRKFAPEELSARAQAIQAGMNVTNEVGVVYALYRLYNHGIQKKLAGFMV